MGCVDELSFIFWFVIFAGSGFDVGVHDVGGVRHVKRGKKRIKGEINQLITPELEKDTEGNKANGHTMNCPFEKIRRVYIYRI